MKKTILAFAGICLYLTSFAQFEFGFGYTNQSPLGDMGANINAAHGLNLQVGSRLPFAGHQFGASVESGSGRYGGMSGTKQREKRGGARPGAGRPPRLTFAQRLKVGLACQDAWRKATKDKLAAKVGAKKRPAHMAKKRKALLDKLAAGALSRAGVAAVLARHGDLSFGKRTRFYRVRGLRPYGLKAEIIARMAKRFEISPRMVKTAWDELRVLERETG